VNRVKKNLLGAMVITVGVGALSACTTDGGASQSSQSASSSQSSSQPSTTSGNSMSSQDLASFVTVTGAEGKSPDIALNSKTPPADLVYQDLKVGSGDVVLPTSTLTTHYTLVAWSSGKVVDSSWPSGAPATFPLSGVIQGWQQGLPGMKVGGRRLLIVPPSLGYGSQANGPLAANETLVFVVDLVAVN